MPDGLATALIVAGMWTHVVLQNFVVLDRVRTRNPIWGELLTVVLAVPLIPLWGLLGRSI